MQKPRLRKDGTYWRCWMPDAQDGHISVSGNTTTAALIRCLYEYAHRLQLDGTQKERVLYNAVLNIWREVDGNIDETAREILVHTDNGRGNEIRESCEKINGMVDEALEVMECLG
ncbi:hypothetical protein [Halomonas sp. 707B3]|uniref:hypothetical protein n=1 Tax=Halomonas sp. 707B3 TaxID=1681043 RepID=UPI00209CCDE4|nr:hypothetical protein [Halomonas sp. 707B3]MCP1316417.1 hypothetical protein [Halomonas sp. 707B3]